MAPRHSQPPATAPSLPGGGEVEGVNSFLSSLVSRRRPLCGAASPRAVCPALSPGRPSAVHVGRRPWDAAAAPQGPCVLAVPGAGPGRPHPTAAPAVRPCTARPSCPGGRALAPAQAGARGAVSAGLAGGPVGVASRSRHGYVAPDALLSRALAGVLGGKPSRKTFLTRKRTSPEEMAVRAGGVGAGTVPGGAPPPRALLCPRF